MRFTKIHTNSLFCCILLAALQVAILVIVNGGLKEVLLGGAAELDTLLVIFSPAGAVAWIAKHFAQAKGDD